MIKRRNFRSFKESQQKSSAVFDTSSEFGQDVDDLLRWRVNQRVLCEDAGQARVADVKLLSAAHPEPDLRVTFLGSADEFRPRVNSGNGDSFPMEPVRPMSRTASDIKDLASRMFVRPITDQCTVRGGGRFYAAECLDVFVGPSPICNARKFNRHKAIMARLFSRYTALGLSNKRSCP